MKPITGIKICILLLILVFFIPFVSAKENNVPEKIPANLSELRKDTNAPIEPKPLYGGDNPDDAYELEFGTEELESFYTQNADNWYYTETSKRGPLRFGIKDITSGDDLDIYVYDYQANVLLCSSAKSGNVNDECSVAKDNDRLWGFYIKVIPYTIKGLSASGYIYTTANPTCQEKWVPDSFFCKSGEEVYGIWRNKDCATNEKLKENCDSSNYKEDWSAPYCSDGNVKESRSVHDYYCGGKGECRDSSSTEERIKEYCDSDEKCSNNACVKKTCSDFSGTYGSCSNENEKRRNGDDAQKCEDQIVFGEILCWKKISQKGNDNFCSVLSDTANKCIYNDYDCDPLECSNDLQCESKNGLSGLGVEGGCCYSGEKWNEELNKCYTPCNLNSVSWDKTSAKEGETVGITALASSGCVNKQVTFEVKENDCFFLSPIANNESTEELDKDNTKQEAYSDAANKNKELNSQISTQGICEDSANINPNPAAFDNNGIARTNWNAEYQDDISGNPEYNVYASYDDQKVKSSSELTVIPECIDDSQCPDLGLKGGLYCLNGNVAQDFEAGICSNSKCGTEIYPATIDTCEHGCINGQCIKEYCGDNVCQDNEDYNSCPNDCKKPEYCGDNICQSNEDYNSCSVDCKKPFEDECANYNNYFCENGFVKKCNYNGNYWEKQKIQQCSGKYQYCNPNAVSIKQSCSLYENKFDLWIDYADTGVIVNKQSNDVLKLNIYSQQDSIVNIDYDINVFDGNCFGKYNIKLGINTCTLNIKENTFGLYRIKVNEKIAEVNIIDDPEFLIVTDSEKLLERFPDEETGVKAVLKQAYYNTRDIGVVYDLSYYDLGSKNPFTKIKDYFEKITKPNVVDNSYSLAVAEFVKDKCNYCKDVLILGDDFVVPHYRSNITITESDWYYLWLNKHQEVENIYTDFPYIISERKGFNDLKSIFAEKVSLLKPNEKKPIIILKPSDTTSSLDSSIESLSTVMQNKFKRTTVIKNSQDFSCNSFDELGYSPLVIIGNSRNNNLIRCYPFIMNDENVISIERNQWSNDEYTVLVNSEGYRLLNGFTSMINSESYSYYRDSFLVGVESNLDTCSWVIYPGFDVIGDVCQGTLDCAFNNNWGWCGADVALVFIPLMNSKYGHIAEWLFKLGDEGITFFRKFGRQKDFLSMTSDLFKKSDDVIKRTLKIINKIPTERVSKGVIDSMSVIAQKYDDGHDVMKALDNIAETKGSERLIKNFPGAIKNIDNPSDLLGKEFQTIQTSKLKNLGEELAEIEAPFKLKSGEKFPVDSLSRENGKIIGTEMKSGKLNDIEKLNELEGQVDKLYELKTKGGLVNNKIVKIDNGRIITNNNIPTDTQKGIDLRDKIQKYGFDLIENGGLN